MRSKRLSISLLVAGAICTSAVATGSAAPPAKYRGVYSSPSAAQFASVVIRTTTAFARSHGDAARLTHIDCVKASSLQFMCSYAVARHQRAPECHLMQAIWTPHAPSAYTVTLAGRVGKCGTVREALRSMRG